MASSAQTFLRGITWKHTRGLLPMLATAQRFEEAHTGVKIAWECRSLQAFADEPLESLAGRFDLLVIDHPSCGRAAADGFLLPLGDVLPAAFLQEQAENSVGASYASYVYDGHLWALPIDAATPISACRTDLLVQAGEAVPQTWDELIALASKGLVIVAGLAIDSLMNFFMLCNALDEEPFASDEYMVSAPVGQEAMQRLRELLQLCPRECLNANPIAVWNALAAGSHAVYCPFAYGYSNYSRRGYAKNVIEAGELVTLYGRPLRSTLGGAGLALSTCCGDVAMAASYAQYVASGLCQSTLYFDAGGQPGHRAAWLDTEVNRRSNGFFEKTLPVLDRAWIRPRFDGYLDFQSEAAELLHEYLRAGGSEARVMEGMNSLLHKARKTHESEAG